MADIAQRRSTIMDSQQFDRLVRSLSSDASRRHIFKAMTAAAIAGAWGTVRRSSIAAAPDPCSVECALEPGPRKAACKQACKKCGGFANICGTLTNYACCAPQSCCGFSPETEFCCPDQTTCCINPGGIICCADQTTCGFDPTTGGAACL
jgi:hypothetical protein